MPAARSPTKTNLLLRIEAYKFVIRQAGILLCRAGAGLVFFFSLGVGLPPSNTVASSDGATERLVAVGDVRGDFDSFCLILRRTGLLDEQNRQVDPSARLVQTRG